jgi:uncharacterized membrane protein
MIAEKGGVKMEFLKKQWTSLLGAFFIFLAVGYFFDYADEQGWISDSFKIGIGIFLGVSLFAIGYMVMKKQQVILGEILSGLGAAIVYTTFSFAGITYAIWSPMTVFLAMLVATSGLAVYAYVFQYRLLMNLGLIGAVISPLVSLPSGDQVFTLFLYMLVVNAVFFYVSVIKEWKELRFKMFFGTWMLYVVYYLHFDPISWEKPLFYASSAYLFYVIGFLLVSWKERSSFQGLNFYFNIVNAIFFISWIASMASDFTLDHLLVLVLSGMGLLYLASSFFIHKVNKNHKTSLIPMFVYLFSGLFLVLTSLSEFREDWEYKPILNVFLWCFVAVLLLFFGKVKQNDFLKGAAVLVWFVVVWFWNFVTHETPMGEFFGVFIPFLNFSGLTWILLAYLGFYMSLRLSVDSPFIHKEVLSTTLSIVSHLIVGGLLYYQIAALWYPHYYAESLASFNEGLAISISWGVYAILLFLWGAYTGQLFFRIFGGIVLGFVAIKTILFDLAGSETVHKMIVLFLLGVICFTITWINHKWKNDN